jgi:protoheme IX farnesyltransferase
MLPTVAGEARTARSILANTVGLLAASALPFALGLLGWIYLIVGVAAGGSLMLARNLALLRRPTDRRLALANFHASNLFLLLLFLGVVLDVALRPW